MLDLIFTKKNKQEGKVVVKFKIANSGNVYKVVVDRTDINDELFLWQMKNIIRSWKFHPLRGFSDATDVVYPFIFNPDL